MSCARTIDFNLYMDVNYYSNEECVIEMAVYIMHINNSFSGIADQNKVMNILGALVILSGFWYA